MKNKRFWMLLGGIALLIAAFLLLNFRLAASSTRADKLIFTMKMPDPLQRSHPVKLVLAGDGSLASSLQKELLEGLEQAGMSGIEVVPELAPEEREPVLVVKVGEPAPLWTPVFAMSRFRVQAGYASDGDTAFMDVIEKTRTSTAKKDVTNLYAEFDVNDRSLGLLSRPGYQQFLAEYLARQIVTALDGLYQG